MDGRVQRRRLRQIERALEATDPELASLMRSRLSTSPAARPAWPQVALGVLGGAIVVTGALTAAFPLIFAGVLMLMVAGCLYVTAPARRQDH